MTFLAVLLALTLSLSAGIGTQGAQAQNESRRDEPSFPTESDDDFDRGKLIVKLEEDASQADLREINRENDATTEENVPKSDVNVVDLPNDLSVREGIEVYEDNPEIEYAEPDFILEPSAMPDDPSYGNMYGLNNTGQTGGTPGADTDAPKAWDISTGKSSTVVAVIDEGVDVNHPDLDDNLWVNTDEIPGNGVDDDKNGYVDDVNGYDFANNDASVYDPDILT
ncbi:MAG: S8 family serine peptidase, partial [Rubrobacteraceae bacterium]